MKKILIIEDDLWISTSLKLYLENSNFEVEVYNTWENAVSFIKKIKEKYPDVLLMADISTFEEGVNAEKAGVDLVGTTMNGYTPYTSDSKKFNPDLVKEIVKNVKVPVIAEGKIHTPEQAKQAFEAGAHCIVVGGAITRPQEIATRFLSELR